MKSLNMQVAVVAAYLMFAVTAPAQEVTKQSAVAAGTASDARQAQSQTIIPRLIKFSGALHDAQGRPQAGPVGVTFALYSQQSDGAALWMETQNVKADENGNYTVLLGANSASGLPAELFVSGEARWLGIQVGQQPEHERILLVSVPYALKAGDAETLGGKPLSSFVLNEASATGSSAGSSPVATSSAAGRTQTTTGASTKTSATPQAATPCSTVTSDGTAAVNSIALFTTACNVQGSIMTQASINGFPGINLAGNNAGLLLNGTGTHQVTVTSTTTGVSGRLGQDSTGFFFSSDTNGKVIKFLANNGTLNEWMRITSAGNVGIGTQTPAVKLDVNGDQNINGNLTLTGTATVTGLGATFIGPGGGVVGRDTNTTVGPAVGVEGLVDSNVAGSAGVVGKATATTGASNIGVLGVSAGDNGAALLGHAKSLTGLTNGLHAISDSTGGLGVFAEATATSGNTIGVQGNTSSPTGIGVFGNSLATTGFNYGVRGFTASGNGVRGDGGGTSAIGVVGVASGTSGIGVDGFASATTGNTIGTRGVASSTSGTGVLGNNLATSGLANGVVGLTSSNGGIGVDGQNLSTTGNTATGTRGFSANPNGQGVLGEVDATGGFSIGVHAIVRSSSGTAGFFENLGTTQGGNLLKADFNATTEFNVDAFGNGFFNGNLGAGTPTPAHTLEVVAGGTTLADAWTTRSTARLKTNIQPIIGALDKVQKLRGVSYDWKANGKHDIGLIAEEVAQVVPEIVAYEQNTNNAQGLDYARLTALLIEAVKQQQTQINLQKAQIRTLQSRLRRIEKRAK